MRVTRIAIEYDSDAGTAPVRIDNGSQQWGNARLTVCDAAKLATATSLNDIYSFGFDGDIVLALNAITRRDDEDYFDFVKRACSNPIA